MSPLKRVSVILGTTLAICALYAGYLLGQKQRGAAPTPSIATAVEPTTEALAFWSFADLEGRERHMSEWAGKLLVVNFWATWCPPCRKEIPGFIALQQRFGADGVQFVGIALDRVEPVGDYVREHGMNYPVLIGEEAVSTYMRALGNTIGALPFSALISRGGEVIATHQGEWPENDVAAAIEAAL